MNRALLDSFPGIQKNIPLAPLTTFKIGGEAEYFFSAHSEAELQGAIKIARESGVPTYLIAGGSNLVVADGTVPGFFIHIAYGSVRTDGEFLVADAGASLASLVEFSFTESLRGLESLSGIPGTVGGAVVGNAGAYGRSIADATVSVRVFDGESVKEFSKEECGFRYRNSRFKDDRALVVLSATFKLEAGNERELRSRSAEIVAKRALTYHPSLVCPGSFFKNVLVSDVPASALARIDQAKIIDGKIPVGYLLEQAGSKGMRQGGIEVAQTHGNLLVNTGGATYTDVRMLADLLRQKVSQKFGIAIEEEIRYIS